MLLTSTSDIVRIVTGSAIDIDIQAGWADITTSLLTPGRTNTKVTTATTTTIVASPAASTQRQVKTLVIRNIHAASSNLVTVQHYDGATSVIVFKYTLLAGETILYTGNEWIVYDSSGVPISITSTSLADGDYGDITVSGAGATWTIDANAVTLAKLATQAANTILANATAGAAVPTAVAIAASKFLARSSAGDLAAKDLSDFALTILDDADAATVRATIGAGVGSGTVDTANTPAALEYARFTDADTIEGRTEAEFKGDFNLEAGVDFQAYDAELAALAGLTSAADKVPYFTGAGTAGVADFTSLARTMLALANPTAIRFYKINADNSISLRTAAEMLSDIGAQASGTYLTSANIVGTITNGVTTNAPSEDAVFDALALKAPLASPTFTGTVTIPVGLTGVIRADVGELSVDADVTDIVAAGTDIAQGKLELATNAETVTGTDTARATTPANITAKMAAPGAIGGTTPSTVAATTLTASNAGNAETLTNTTDAASVQVAVWQGDRATIADGDEAYISLKLSDSAGNQDEGARVTWKATTVLNGATQDTDMILAALVNNVLTTMLTLDGSASELVVAVGIRAAGITSPDLGTITTIDINGGTVDGATIGAASATTGKFTTVETTGGIELGNASDTTLTRSGGGVLAVEGIVIPSVSSINTLTNKTYDLGENTPIILDAALSADGKYSGITDAGFLAGATLAFGDLVYLQTSNSRWVLTDANAAATCSNILGICVLAAAGDGSATTVLTYGKVRADAAFPALTIGAAVFAGTTAGDIQVAAPSGAADIIRIVGHASTADELFFAPSPDYFEHV